MEVTSRRATMYRLSRHRRRKRDGTIDAMEQRMVPLDRHLDHGRKRFLPCNMAPVHAVHGADTEGVDPNSDYVHNDPLTAVGINVLTLTAVGSIPGESARTTLSQSVAVTVC
jgi:hypothetical protein